jgi:hypothetical protein
MMWLRVKIFIEWKPVDQIVTRYDQVTKSVVAVDQFAVMSQPKCDQMWPGDKIGIGCKPVDQNVTSQPKCDQGNKNRMEFHQVDHNVPGNKIGATCNKDDSNVTETTLMVMQITKLAFF